MTRSRPRKTFTEGQVAAALADYDAGVKVPEICRRHGISERTFYLWRARRKGGEEAGAGAATLLGSAGKP